MVNISIHPSHRNVAPAYIHFIILTKKESNSKYRDENTKNIQHFVGPETKDD